MNSQQAWSLLRDYCPTIAGLIEDPSISEIEANPSGMIFTERAGRTVQENLVMPELERETFCEQIARKLGKDISRDNPLMDARLPDGSRVAAVCPPVSKNWTFTIRKFSDRRFTLDDLVKLRTITAAQRDVLERAVAHRKTIMISGETSSGKTTLLNALAAIMPKMDRIVLIEDTAEIRVDSPNLVSFESQNPLRNIGLTVTIRDLVKQSLRFRPDRIIIGEVRGVEAFDLLQALNSGHAGSMSTIHANSARLAVGKLAMFCQTAESSIPARALAWTIADAIHVVVQIRRDGRRRIVSEIVSLEGYDSKAEDYIFGVA